MSVQDERVLIIISIPLISRIRPFLSVMRYFAVFCTILFLYRKVVN